ncbi:MAG: septum formation protein Maf [Prevotella sp.]|nr:septum formation protein Maf [Prevotella sp.]
MKKIILASNSPRRKELLSGLGISFEVHVLKDIDESYPDDLPASEVANFISHAKAKAYKNIIGDDELVITADTVVVLDDMVLGKPATREEAVEMLKALSGKTHHVITGVCLTTTEEQRALSVTSEVTFKVLADEEIDYYVDNYRPYDKAGAYGIQEWIGYIGVTALKGSYFNVMGLPVQRIYQELVDMFGVNELIRGDKALP